MKVTDSRQASLSRSLLRALLQAVLLCSMLAVFRPHIASADTAYSYTGQAYTNCSGTYTPPCSQFSITGSFTTSLSLSQLENLNDFRINNTDITALSFSDGSGLTINLSDATLTGALASGFSLTTNGSGDILNWIVGVNEEPSTLTLGTVADNITTISLSPGLVQDSSVTGTITNVTACLPVGCVAGSGGSNQNTAGTWGAPMATPEPSSLILLATGLLGVRLRRKRQG